MRTVQIRLMVVTIIFILIQEIFAQNDFQQRPEGRSGETFYLDQQSSCHGTSSFSVTGTTTIIGRSGTTGSSIPKECTITLASFAQKPTKFQLEIKQMRLNEDMKFYIFDGDSTSAILKSYDFYKNNDAFIPIFTTGSKVTFKLTRDRMDDNSNYDIRIIAETREDYIKGGDGWNPRLDRDTQTVRKFDTDIIIILMSCAFLFAFLIYAIVLLVCWRRRSKGGEKWTERPMGYDNPSLAKTNSTLAYVEQVKSHPPDDPRVQSPANFNKMNGRRQPHGYQTRMAQSSVDAESVFEGENGERTRRRIESNNRPSQNGSYHNQAYQQTPVKSRARLSQRSVKSSYLNKESSSPAGSDTRSQDNDRLRHRQKKPVSPQPEESDSESEDEVERVSIGLNTDPEMTDHGVQCDAEEEEPEQTLSKPSTVQTSVGVDSSPMINSQRNSPRPKQHYRPPSYEEAVSDTEYPVVNTGQSRPSSKNQTRLPYVHYSNPTFHRPEPVYSLNPERPPYHAGHSHHNPLPRIGDDNHIPIYSYLVNRGYHIDDRQSSGDLTSHRSDSRMGHTDDSDCPANLDCGVELMRR